MSIFEQQHQKILTARGFIAALDQSGGSTPKALKLYGVNESAYNGDEEMFAAVHQMRSRIITSPNFGGDRILAAILFENTLDRTIEGSPTARYLWQEKNIVPILKVDQGLAGEQHDVQLMKPIPNLSALLKKARTQNVYGTKMRSVIKQANAKGIAQVVAQQFEISKQIIAAGLVPIIEPEIDIQSPNKAAAETLLRTQLLKQLDQLQGEGKVILKLTLPNQANFYSECIKHANIIRVVALSGGYSRAEANSRTADNHGMIASFSRALTEGLNAQQNDAQFNQQLNSSIEAIYQASSS